VRRATTAEGGGVARHLKSRPADLLITDVLMPDVEGLDTIRQARALRPELPIIAISGKTFVGIDYLSAAVRFAAVATLRKPFSPDALLRVIEDLLAADGVDGAC
jgi:DNA-binding NtrC family response regulator